MPTFSRERAQDPPTPPLPPYVPLYEMRPLQEADGRLVTTAELDGTGAGSWADRFDKLIRSRLGGSNFNDRQEGPRFFDKIVCIGMMKSGTTSVGVAMKRVGLKHLGRWTGPMLEANKMDGTLVGAYRWERPGLRCTFREYGNLSTPLDVDDITRDPAPKPVVVVSWHHCHAKPQSL